MRKRSSRRRHSILAAECEAFLDGTLAEYRDERGVPVPIWAWMNLLSHGSEELIGTSIAGPARPRRTARNGRIARSYLAHRILSSSDARCTLFDLQWNVLIPLSWRWHSSRGAPYDAVAVGGDAQPGDSQRAFHFGAVASRSGALFRRHRAITQRSTVRAECGQGRIPARSTRSWNALRSIDFPAPRPPTNGAGRSRADRPCRPSAWPGYEMYRSTSDSTSMRGIGVLGQPVDRPLARPTHCVQAGVDDETGRPATSRRRRGPSGQIVTVEPISSARRSL